MLSVKRFIKEREGNVRELLRGRDVDRRVVRHAFDTGVRVEIFVQCDLEHRAGTLAVQV